MKSPTSCSIEFLEGGQFPYFFPGISTEVFGLFEGFRHVKPPREIALDGNVPCFCDRETVPTHPVILRRLDSILAPSYHFSRAGKRSRPTPLFCGNGIILSSRPNPTGQRSYCVLIENCSCIFVRIGGDYCQRKRNSRPVRS